MPNRFQTVEYWVKVGDTKWVEIDHELYRQWQKEIRRGKKKYNGSVLLRRIV